VPSKTSAAPRAPIPRLFVMWQGTRTPAKWLKAGGSWPFLVHPHRPSCPCYVRRRRASISSKCWRRDF